jgi:hypothetical protein
LPQPLGEVETDGAQPIAPLPAPSAEGPTAHQ